MRKSLVASLPEVPPLSLRELYAFLGKFQVLEPDTELVMREANERKWRDDAHDSPHQHAWHTAFHASEFPGDDSDACQRRLVYRMMNLPPLEPMPPWVTTTATVGSAGEDDIVRAWALAGRLLSAHPDDEHQTYFEDPDAWLTASTDATVLLPGWHKPHVVEIKGKADEVVQEMNSGLRRWDKPHRRQVLTSLAAAHKEHPWQEVEVCRHSWRLAQLIFDDDADPLHERPLGRVCPEHMHDDCLQVIQLDPPDTCSIYYWSRSWPRGNPRNPLTQPIEYFFELDMDFMESGLAVLREARNAFREDRIPERPSHFQWSMGSCKDCNYKKEVCKPDFKAKIQKLSESHGIAWAKSVRADYDLSLVRAAVEGRWL